MSDRASEKREPIDLPGVRAADALLAHAPGRIVAIRWAGEPTGARGALIERATAAGVPVERVRPNELERRAPESRHQGVVTTTRPSEYFEWADLLAPPRSLLLAFDQVTDPHNLGAALRSLEALGGDGALITRNRCARLGPAAARTSAGASELLPVALETNLARALREAQDAGFRVFGADLDGQRPDTVDLTVPLVIVLGAEGSGLRPSTRKACDDVLTIPLTGRTESLNASVAASILIYEVRRQRGSCPRGEAQQF